MSYHLIMPKAKLWGRPSQKAGVRMWYREASISLAMVSTALAILSVGMSNSLASSRRFWTYSMATQPTAPSMSIL